MNNLLISSFLNIIGHGIYRNKPSGFGIGYAIIEDKLG